MTNIKTIKIPISSLVNEQIQTHYDTPEKIKELRKSLIQKISAMCTNASKMVLIKKIPCEIDVAKDLKRQIQTQDIPLSEFNLDDYNNYAKEDPNWLPDELKDEKPILFFELKIREHTYENLKLSAKLFHARMEKYITSLEMSAEEKKKLTNDQKTKFAQAKEMKSKQAPQYNCIEHFIYEHLFAGITESLLTKIESGITADFEEDYPDQK